MSWEWSEQFLLFHGGFVPLTDDSVDEMLRNARVAASTDRTAALGRHGQWPVWAVS